MRSVFKTVVDQVRSVAEDSVSSVLKQVSIRGRERGRERCGGVVRGYWWVYGGRK